MDRADELTTLLASASRNGRPPDEVVPLVYEELRRIAHRAMARERPGHTLDTTALVHEAYLEIARLRHIEWKSRAHFFAVCGRIIRHVLVDHAVERKAQKRGGGSPHLALDEALHPAEDPQDRWIELHEALSRLAELSPRQARVVECRFFAGMSVEDTAEALEISPATVKRDWTIARAWLNARMSR